MGEGGKKCRQIWAKNATIHIRVWTALALKGRQNLKNKQILTLRNYDEIGVS